MATKTQIMKLLDEHLPYIVQKTTHHAAIRKVFEDCPTSNDVIKRLGINAMAWALSPEQLHRLALVAKGNDKEALKKSMKQGL